MYVYPQFAAARPRLGRLQMSALRRSPRLRSPRTLGGPVLRRRQLLGSSSSSTAAAAPAVSGGLIDPSSYCQDKCKQTTNNPNGQTILQLYQTAIQTGFLEWPPPATVNNCAGLPASSGAAKIAQSGSIAAGAAGGVSAALVSGGIIGASAATAAIPIVGAIVAPILLIVGTIFANHAQAVAQANNVICENVPTANAALQAIDTGLANGTITPAQAATAYATVASQFSAAMHSDPTYKSGDAMWYYEHEMDAVIAQRTLNLQNGIATGGGSLPSTLETSTSGVSSLSPAVLIGGGLLLAYLLL
jgi:hypothetical protein